MCYSTENNEKTLFLDILDKFAKAHSSKYLIELTINLIKSFKTDYNCVVSSVITDNAFNMNAMRSHIKESTH